ncbi:MAG: mechanosensitive ion channel family protein [Euryarchaeota archaeon]|nr:mechanosensitive ion channel family protein [Euryarchaeota archaeon]MDE1835251.1 mechanosensitive ion channel family protein [Euryarchaeota archaeon]MDE1881087.1 mechanosensitive ion channel family protein [Euryarchaeota archaeon]MDE2043547.1 mechanosensitive ion channel family protein [Thermoplasmata archaeon]
MSDLLGAAAPWLELLFPTFLGLVTLALVAGFVQARVSEGRWRRTLHSLVAGPGLAVVLGYAVLVVAPRLQHDYPRVYPDVLAQPVVELLVELAVLSTVVGFGSASVTRHLDSPKHPARRYLRLGVYAAGFLGLLYVLLSNPDAPRAAPLEWSTLGFLAGLTATYLVVHIIDVLLERYMAGAAARQPRLQTIYVFLRRLMLVAVALVGLAVTVSVTFPGAALAVSSLILAAGFLSIVVGLAAQPTLSNLFAGILVATTQPFEIGDAVVFPYPNGDWCIVEDIRLNFTVLRTWDLRRLMVPNSMFQSNIVVNYTAVDPTMLVIVYLVITYGSDVDRAREIMVEEARKHPDCKPLGNLPITHVMDYQGGGNQGSGMYGGVDLRLLSAAKDQSTAFQVEKDLLYTIRKRFEAEGIQLAYPTQRVILERAADPGPRRGPAGPGPDLTGRG